MALRSWDADHSPSRVVALWKDAKRGAQEISLGANDEALLLTLTAGQLEEWCADGRSSGARAAELVLSGVEGIRAPPAK
jgi:hypothetical protein